MRTTLRFAPFVVDVTPPIGHALCGGFLPLAKGVRDPLFARGVVLDDGRPRVVLCAVDFCGVAGRGHRQWTQTLAAAQPTDRERRVTLQALRLGPAWVLHLPSEAFFEYQYAVVIAWQGNLATNLNDYTLLLCDTEHLGQPPRPLLTAGFGYDTFDQNAAPLRQFAFLADGRLTMLATLRGEPSQAVALDPNSGRTEALTAHPGALLAFAATPDGAAIVYAAETPRDDARTAAMTWRATPPCPRPGPVACSRTRWLESRGGHSQERGEPPPSWRPVAMGTTGWHAFGGRDDPAAGGVRSGRRAAVNHNGSECLP